MGGEQPFEHRAKGGPAQGKDEPDQGEQKGEARQRERLPVVIGEDIRLHGHDAVNIDLGVDELQEEAGQKALPGVVLLHAATPEGLPGEVEHIGRAGHQHGQFDLRDKGGQRTAKGRTEQHDDGEPHADPEIEGQGPPEALPAPVGHGHDVVGARRDRGHHRIGQKGEPGKHI